MPRRRDRTFTGCWKCRSRKVKCDETRPECLACQRIGSVCTGYDAKFVWVEGSSMPPRSEGRRVLPSNLTWKGFQVLDSDMVDHLISRCDPESETEASQYIAWEPSCHSPFSVFSASVSSKDSDALLWDIDDVQEIPRSLELCPDSSSTEIFLFHHYVTHVSIIMLPYQHPRNLWTLEYPAVALKLLNEGQGALYNALLAQSAFHIAYLRGHDQKMLGIASKNYTSSINQLLPSIGYLGNDFPSLMATIMTLLFTETYSGQPREWRRHLQGAWALLEQHFDAEPWKLTDLACVSLQSLNITKIIAGTSARSNESTASRDISSPILSTTDFGFTIGAPREVLECIARITEFRQQRESVEGGDRPVEELLHSLLSCLNHSLCAIDMANLNSMSPYQKECMGDIASNNGETRIGALSQSKAFIYATYIYLFRTLLNSPPQAVRQYVANVFTQVSIYFTAIQDNFSMWPAFIAAAEAYTEEDLAAAGEWLNRAMSFGLGSRKALKAVLEEVWKRRQKISMASGLEPGLIIVDWRQVTHELDCDVLIV